jgi:hypothetical protein
MTGGFFERKARESGFSIAGLIRRYFDLAISPGLPRTLSDGLERYDRTGGGRGKFTSSSRQASGARKTSR